MTVWITCFFHYVEAPVADPQPVQDPIARESAKTMIWLWHDRATDPGDVTDKEVAILWKKFQADPKTDDIGVRMIRRRVSMLWREYLTTN